MCDIEEPLRVTYSSYDDEEFLVADLETACGLCCQVLKLEESGRVFVGFFVQGQVGRRVLVDVGSFALALQNASIEIGKLTAPPSLE